MLKRDYTTKPHPHIWSYRGLAEVVTWMGRTDVNYRKITCTFEEFLSFGAFVSAVIPLDTSLTYRFWNKLVFLSGRDQLYVVYFAYAGTS